MVEREEARERLQEAYGEYYDEDVGDLSVLHDAVTGFLAKLDSHTDGELPEDLDANTKRQLNATKTQLSRAISGIEETAVERLEDSETQTEE